jgi:hypothetical protein
MNAYNDASLIMYPSGYKAGKLYSLKPTNGTGDFTVVRNTTATRVNAEGLIEGARTNVLLQSVWPSIGTGVAPTSWSVGIGPAINFSAGPLAGQLLCNTSANRGFIQQTVSLTAGQYALSVFVDSVTTSNQIASMISIFGATDLKYYEDGIQVISSKSIVAGKRYAVVGTVTTASFGMRVGSGVTANATANYVISRPQLEVSDFGATDYIPTTTAAVSVGIIANVPRIDYTGGGCGKLLVEPAATNLVLRSEEFNDVSWLTADTTVTANAEISPSGALNADTMTVSTSDSAVRQITVLGAGTYTFSVYVKIVAETTAGSMRLQAIVDGSNVSVSFTPTTQWQRVTTTVTAVTSVTTVRVRGLGFVGTLAIWGAQLEVGSVATSYIPTVAATATRNADVISKTGVSALIGQSQGTLYAEVDIRNFAAAGIFLSISDATSSNRVQLYKFTDSKIYADRISATQSALTSISTSALSIGIYKVAFAYSSGNSALFINGVQIGSTALQTFTFGAMGKINIGSRFDDTQIINDRIQAAAIYPIRLTNAQLASLTTL